QLILSILYLFTNSFFTAVCMQSEWSSYALNRKGLRVSSDKQGSQRSTYFLQLPYRYSIPLLIVFGILHWLASQSMSVTDSILDDYPIAFIEYSPLATLIGCVTLGVLLVFIGVLWSWRMQVNMPVMRGCSAVIAAACQPKDEERDHGVQWTRVQWGVICQPLEQEQSGTAHCGFSNKYVGMPIEGRLYAG
ncbi:hypothetical protein P280DRAFT_398168, partial [Massarina eburnea CBS 473.64]